MLEICIINGVLNIKSFGISKLMYVYNVFHWCISFDRNAHYAIFYRI